MEVQVQGAEEAVQRILCRGYYAEEVQRRCIAKVEKVQSRRFRVHSAEVRLQRWC